MSRFLHLRAVLLAFSLLLTGACAPAEPDPSQDEQEAELPEIPPQRGPLNILLIHPMPGAVKPNVDSTFLFGTVGNGAAELQVNSQPVEVAPNGAFLTFLPIPNDNTYRLEARLRDQTDVETFTYAPPPSLAPDTRPILVAFEEPQRARVVAGRDTLDTGSEIASASPVPAGDRRWFFPIGARVTVTGRLDSLYRIQLTDSVRGWLDDTSTVDILGAGVYDVAPVGQVRVHPQASYTDVIVPVDFAPFHIAALERQLGVTVYGRTASQGSITPGGVVERAAWTPTGPDSSRLLLNLNEGLWGFKAFYEPDGSLVVRIRRAPTLDPDQPLRRLRIVVDPGHPPGGAIGPTGLTEAEVNLEISLRLADMLRERGAVVLMTRTTSAPLVSAVDTEEELWARADTAVAFGADLLISVHNNAFPDGINPFKNFGTETYYFYGFSAPLAQELVSEIWDVTGIPNLGAKQRSLAAVRPTWFPSTLTESLFLMFPRQEAALRNPDVLDRLAVAHVNGIVHYLHRYQELSPRLSTP